MLWLPKRPNNLNGSVIITRKVKRYIKQCVQISKGQVVPVYERTVTRIPVDRSTPYQYHKLSYIGKFLPKQQDLLPTSRVYYQLLTNFPEILQEIPIVYWNPPYAKTSDSRTVRLLENFNSRLLSLASYFVCR